MKFINQFFKFHKKEVLLFFMMLVLELVMIFVLSQRNGLSIFFRSDGFEYQTLAINLINHGEFSLDRQAPFVPTDYRTPIYPAWLVIIYFIFNSFKPAIFIGAALFALSAPLAYLISKEFFRERIALVSAILFAIEPWGLFQSGFLAAEQIATPIFLLTIYFFCQYLKLKKLRYLYLSSLLLGFATMIRPATLYFILIFALLTFIAERKGSFLRSFKISALVILIFIAALSPWLIRNKIALNIWQLSSAASNGILYIESYNLNKYLGKITDEPEWQKAAQILNKRGYDSIKNADDTKILADYAIKEIKANKTAFIAMHLKSMALFFIKNSYGNIFLDLKIKNSNIQSKIGNYVLHKDFNGVFKLAKDTNIGSKFLILLLFFWPIVIFFAIIGIFEIFKNNHRNILYWFLIFWILYFVALLADFHDISRYKLSINLPLIALAVFGFNKIKILLYKNKTL